MSTWVWDSVKWGEENHFEQSTYYWYIQQYSLLRSTVNPLIIALWIKITFIFQYIKPIIYAQSIVIFFNIIELKYRNK